MRISRDDRSPCPPGHLLCPHCGADQGYMSGSDADAIAERCRWRCEECLADFDADVDRELTFYVRRSRPGTLEEAEALAERAARMTAALEGEAWQNVVANALTRGAG